MNTSTPSQQQLSTKTQLLVASLLLFVMIVTRSHISAHLQDASWAIFFLVGFYLRGSSLVRLGFPVFFLAAFVIDLIVIDAQGGTHYCFTPSYPFLIPAYAAMWFAGRWVANRYQENMRGLASFVGAALVGVAACFLISNAGFYFFAGKFEEMTVMQYTASVAHYLPAYLKTTAIYLGSAAILHLLIEHATELRAKLDDRAHS